MADTYTQLYIHIVFAVRNRQALIHSEWEPELYKYISGCVKNNGHKLICINGMPDHVHLLIGLHPTQSVSALLQDIKTNSSKWINEKKFCKYKFEWQAGFGAFSYSRSQIPQVVNYINKQKEHHQKQSFTDEYVKLLRAFDIEYNPKYIFTEPQ